MASRQGRDLACGTTSVDEVSNSWQITVPLEEMYVVESKSYDDLTPEEARRDHWEMLRFIAINAGFGVFLGFVVAAMLILFDIGGLCTHLRRAHEPILPALLLAIPLALTFGAAVAASAIMLMPYKKKKHR